MKDLAAREYEVNGYKLECPVCKHNKFWTRDTLMNTPGMSFFGFDWANRSADNYVCDRCGNVLWFVEKPVK